jgi:hypothetical protein
MYLVSEVCRPPGHKIKKKFTGLNGIQRSAPKALQRYSIAITLCYIFVLSHNASTLWRKVIASFSYRFGLIEIVIASYSYRSSLKGIVIASYSYRSKVTTR